MTAIIKMKSIIILYMPGHAGTFLSRLFSLTEETMPQLTIQLLQDCVNHGRLPDVNNRVEWYSFSDVHSKYETWQKFHADWADFYNRIDFELLNAFYNNKHAIVYAMHPHEFDQFELEIKQLGCSNFYYVELDLAQHGNWVNDAEKKLNFIVRDQEAEGFEKTKNNYCMQKISLTKMLLSESDFLAEYLRVCKLMQLTPCVDQALALYHNWRQVRVN